MRSSASRRAIAPAGRSPSSTRPRASTGCRRRRARSSSRPPSTPASAASRTNSSADCSNHSFSDLGELLDRAQHLVVRQRAEAGLEEEAVVPEDLVLEEDLLDDLVDASDEKVSAARPPGVVIVARHRREAALAAN